MTRLEFKTSQDTLISSSSQVYADNVRFQDEFGGEQMLVLLTGDVRDVIAPDNLERLRALETELRATGLFHAVVGPVTALELALDELAVAPDLMTAESNRSQAAAAAEAREEAAAENLSIAEQEAAATAAADEVAQARAATMQAEMVRIGAAGEQSLDNPAFAEFLLFDAQGEIRPALRDSFPDDEHAMLVVRLPGNASIEEQGKGTDQVREVVAEHPLRDVEMLASGSPVLLKEINDYLQGGMATLGLFAVGVMLVLLWFLFRVRWRLLPLAVVAVGSVWAFGLAGWLGVPLSLVTISGLPIFIGLGVDFAIQMQNRYLEERSSPHRHDPVLGTYRNMASPLVVAMVAAAVGFMALRVSSVPMIRDFGIMLAAGVVALVAAAIVLPVTALHRSDKPLPPQRAGGIERVVRFLGSLPGRMVVPVVIVGLAVAGAGLVVEGDLGVQTDPERWVDQDGTAVRDLEALREGTGFSSELSLLIEADDVTSDEVVAWMDRLAATELERHPDVLLRATSLPVVASAVHGGTPVGQDVATVLPLLPSDVARVLVTDDHRAASMLFPISPVSLGEREAVLDAIAADLESELRPPEGVRATPAGLATVAIELVNGMEANRRTLSLVSLGLVLAWLFLRYRNLSRAVVPLVPVVIAVGASSLVIGVLGIELTPLTTVAGPLVIAIATEFAVLLQSRYVEERADGRTPTQAAREGLPHISRAFIASGVTLVGGFAVLAASAMPVLRDFGVVVAINVVIALLCALVVMPPLLMWSDDRRARARSRRYGEQVTAPVTETQATEPPVPAR
jgi:hydrophobe/amphiphile efflux-3 (HAE3) family protein